MCYLAQGMYARVRPPGALQLYLRVERFGGGRFQLALNGTGVDLLLPAGKLGTVIFKREFKGLLFKSLHGGASGRRITFMAQEPQTLKNHTRFDPAFHFFLAPLALFFLIEGIVRLVRNPDWYNGVHLAAAIWALVALFLIRTYALEVQDRVIRLEERLDRGNSSGRASGAHRQGYRGSVDRLAVRLRRGSGGIGPEGAGWQVEPEAGKEAIGRGGRITGGCNLPDGCNL